jgi:hypothetical protein
MPSSFPNINSIYFRRRTNGLFLSSDQANLSMRIKNRLHSILIQAVLLTVIIFVAIITLFGSVTPNPPSIQIGYFRMTKITNGFSLYQPGGPYRYYPLSNDIDFINLTDGTKFHYSQVNTPEPNFIQSKINQINDTFMYYFRVKKLINIINTGKEKIIYTANISGDTIRVTKTLATLPKNTTSSVSIIPYNRDDLVFDLTGFIYTESLPEDMYAVTKLTGLNLSPEDYQVRYTQIQGKSAVIVNPNIPGALVITAGNNQTITVDKNNKHIEITQFIQPGVTSVSQSFDIRSISHYQNITNIWNK